MPSVVGHWYLFYSIILTYLSLSIFNVTQGHHSIGKEEVEDWFRAEAPSVLCDRFGDSICNYHQRPAFSSSLSEILSCEDLEGVGSFNTTCLLTTDVYLNSSIYAFGTGNLDILPHVSIICEIEDCLVSFNVSGNVKLGRYASIAASSIIIYSHNLTLGHHSSLNTTSLAGKPPPQTSGTPVGYDGAGGGHGGRGASCLKDIHSNAWGGDVYSWSTLSKPWSHGSKGGGTSGQSLGGNGGGRIMVVVREFLYLNGSIAAEGGDGGAGGGGSGGSIIIHAYKLQGFGFVSAAGGRGWGGGGGGRISLHCYSIQEDVKVTVHGGFSIGCPVNSGAAGTYFDSKLLSLRVSNDNITTETETPLLDFATRPLWSKVFVESRAKVLVPLLWTRVQLRGQISVLSGGSISFGLSQLPVSEFELVAEELLMSDSAIKVYGAFRVAVKILLMWNSVIQIDGGGNNAVSTSILEVRNLVVLREHSVICSNSNLALYGQGLLKLTGQGDAIKSQRLSLSLFYNITVGSGALLQAPLENDVSRSMVIKSLCESHSCPMDLISPPDDCHANNTMSFSFQICRVEDVLVNGLIRGSIIHIHRARNVIVGALGMITATKLGCTKGIGRGRYSNGAGGGAGHGGKGGSGMFNGRVSEGGGSYGNAEFPCELGSGSEGPNESYGYVAGGGMIVMGAIQWPILKLNLYGSLRADGQSCCESARNNSDALLGGLGGGSGGTILLFLQKLMLAEESHLSVVGGNGGSLGGGGGGGGRVHFHWSNINTGDEYSPIAAVSGSINSSGGAGDNPGRYGEEGTVTGKKCPKGLYGTFCNECPVGTFKDIDGSDPSCCTPCPAELLPRRADFIYVRGGVSQPSCPYKCITDKYRMPHCFTPFEELINTFGGPWLFSLLLLCVVLLLALLLNSLRIKMIGPIYAYHGASSFDGDQRHPHLLSLSEVRGPSRAEETQSHVHRMYFMGPNTFREPWHLPYTPPSAVVDLVYEDAFNRFIDEINAVAAYDWWEGSVHSILSVLAYPCAWSWKQWRRRIKIGCLQEYVKSEYDHSCLRSCRSRALYKGMKVGATPDLMVAYIDFFLGGDEKRLDTASIMQKRFPMCIIFGGDGSYMSPYNLHNDALLTNLLTQHVPASVWNHMIAGLNAQLRTVRRGFIHSTIAPVINWVNSHANTQLEFHGVRIDLGWFHATASGYYKLGILVVVDDYYFPDMPQPMLSNMSIDKYPRDSDKAIRKIPTGIHESHPQTSQASSYRRTSGGINAALINDATLKTLKFRRNLFFRLSLFLQNTRPVGYQDTLQLLISIMILADLSVTLLTLLQYYWMSLGAFLCVLLILPLSLLSPFPAGLNALFSKGRRRASLARMYALWNTTSLSNIAVAFISGILCYVFSSSQQYSKRNTASVGEYDVWWLLPAILLLLKCIQSRLIDWHIANVEIPNSSLFIPDPDTFWALEPTL